MRILVLQARNFPVSPYVLNLWVPFHHLNFGGGVSEAPCFIVFSGGRPLNLGGEIVTLGAPNLGGMG